MKKPLILMVSESMDGNKKDERNEDGLVRMSQATRNHMGFDSQVELWKHTEKPIDGKIKQAKLLKIFHAFKSDIQLLKKTVNSGELEPKDTDRIGFVTSNTYHRLIGGHEKTKADVWISETVEDVPLGADPEFLLFNEDKIVSAMNVTGFSKYTKIGSDGAMAELRPDPATTPSGLVKNIGDLFKDTALTDSIKDLGWFGSCYHYDNNRSYPVGGHIHFGNPIQIMKLSEGQRIQFFRATNKIIDELLSIPMIRLDGDNGNKRRTMSNMGRYGMFGDMRVSSGRLEHRTLSGIWLVHPELSSAVLGTAKAIIEEIYRHVSDKKFDINYMIHTHLQTRDVFSNTFDRWGEIPLTVDLKCVRSSKNMHKLLNESKRQYINKPYLLKWFSRMKAMSTYEQYSSYIDRLYDILKAPVSAIDSVSLNIKDGWLEGKNLGI